MKLRPTTYHVRAHPRRLATGWLKVSHIALAQYMALTRRTLYFYHDHLNTVELAKRNRVTCSSLEPLPLNNKWLPREAAGV